MKRLTKAGLVAVCTTGMFTALAAPGTGVLAAPGDPVQVVATGFAGPLHVAAGPGGVVYVADAFAGSVHRVSAGGTVTELVSSPGTFTPGVDVKGGQVYFTESADPHAGAPDGTTRLLRWTEDGVTEVADTLAWEYAHNPDGQPQRTGEDADSNPYAVLALPGRTIVADAAGNSLVEVRANGAMRTLTTFPVSLAGECATRPNNGVPDGGCDPTPTDVKLGPDGFLYVSGLGGEAEGHIWKVNATSGRIVDHQGGFPPLTGLAVASDGALFVASLFTGQVFRLAGGAMTVADVPGPAGLDWANGTLYAGVVDFEGGPGSLVTIAPSAFHAP